MKYVKVLDIKKTDRQVEIFFCCSEELKIYFNTNKFSYESSEYDISKVPDDICIIPFITNVLPIIWLTDSELIIPSIDKTFFDCIDNFKKGYVNMYPDLSFKGKLSISAIKENEYHTKGKLIMFSGGVDAICTTLRHLDEDIELLTLWGSADYPTNNIDIWNIHWGEIEDFAAKTKLKCTYIRTDFTEFIPCGFRVLDKLLKSSKRHWWHDFQHGIGILGHAAPIAYLKQLETVYIASSYDEERKPYTCASDPSIDNFVEFGSTKVIHDGYELNRQGKIAYIVQRLKEFSFDITVHVCLHQNLKTNCCHCEKCYRTILGLLVEGVVPQKLGFNFSEKDLPKLLNNIQNKLELADDKIIVYKQIQRRALINKEKIEYGILIEWFESINFNNINMKPRKILAKNIRTIKKVLKGIFHKSY